MINKIDWLSIFSLSCFQAKKQYNVSLSTMIYILFISITSLFIQIMMWTFFNFIHLYFRQSPTYGIILINFKQEANNYTDLIFKNYSLYRTYSFLLKLVLTPMEMKILAKMKYPDQKIMQILKCRKILNKNYNLN